MSKILLVLGVNPATIVFREIFLQRFPDTVVVEREPSWDLIPDLIVSYGPKRLSAEFISLARLGGINIHWGICPWYRGMHTARFALLEGKPEWVGLTIHKLDATLDTGDIIYQARPELKIGDSYKMVEHRLNMLACEIVPNVVREVLNGTVECVSQDRSTGRNYLGREWTKECEGILTPGFIAQQIDSCTKENRQVELINDYFTLS